MCRGEDARSKKKEGRRLEHGTGTELSQRNSETALNFAENAVFLRVSFLSYTAFINADMALQQQSQSKTKTSMQSQRTSMKTRSGSTPLRCRSSRRACRVNAFLSTTEISRRALCLPSPFTHSNKQLSCPTNLLTEDTVYQGSDWVDLFPEQSKVRV